MNSSNHHISEIDFTGRRCVFYCALSEGKPVVGADGCLLPGETKLAGEVVAQESLGPRTVGKLRGLEVARYDWKLQVRGGSGATVWIKYLANRFTRVD